MKYFGTDGFRGKANEVLTADHAFNIGKFLGWYFTDGAHKRRAALSERIPDAPAICLNMPWRQA